MRVSEVIRRMKLLDPDEYIIIEWWDQDSLDLALEDIPKGQRTGMLSRVESKIDWRVMSEQIVDAIEDDVGHFL